jgi:membrane fusion protein (multidrug efflux system)
LFTVAAFGDQSFNGSVKFISPNVRAASRDLVIEAVVPNADQKLKPGMFTVAKLLIGNRPTPVVPDAALRRDETATRLFVVGADKTVQERIVQTGEKQGEVVGILAGVKAGEQVVLNPSADVRDGARVE